MLGSGSNPIEYAVPCGFLQRSITLSKGLEEIQIPDCDDPDKVDWLARDAVSLSMSIAGDGVLAAESVETWLNAVDDFDSVPVKVELEFPSVMFVWTGDMVIDSVEIKAANGRRVTISVSMQSDGEMLRGGFIDDLGMSLFVDDLGISLFVDDLGRAPAS